ncbi:hypothetical protein [Geodermatophilus maliterrae]|uniref:Uncharacterized protein n=1 Tax=Geodermatophilus maliterrae TaxID=3162531 RepID=A0ABV3XBR2_9ACTN
MTADYRLATLVDALAGEPGVTPPQPGGCRFGSTALEVGGAVVAMVVDGAGSPFPNGRGQPMREWVALGDHAAGDLPLAREALAFVAAGRR